MLSKFEIYCLWEIVLLQHLLLRFGFEICGVVLQAGYDRLVGARLLRSGLALARRLEQLLLYGLVGAGAGPSMGGRGSLLARGVRVRIREGVGLAKLVVEEDELLFDVLLVNDFV